MTPAPTNPNEVSKIVDVVESVKKVLDVIEMTEAQIRKDGREYNPSAWDATISRFAKYPACKFYKAKKDAAYAYERYFATYRTPEGIIFFNGVSYSSALTSNGFCRITIAPDGSVYRHLLRDAQGKEGRGANDAPNRKIMAGNSQKFGAIFSNKY